MEIRVLRYFLETAREGNMTRAAERLFISQPTMSKQLKELENELGTKLFIRSNYNIRLTEAGMLLRERAEDILSLVDKTEAEFKSLEEINSGEESFLTLHRLINLQYNFCPMNCFFIVSFVSIPALKNL